MPRSNRVRKAQRGEFTAIEFLEGPLEGQARFVSNDDSVISDVADRINELSDSQWHYFCGLMNRGEARRPPIHLLGLLEAAERSPSDV